MSTAANSAVMQSPTLHSPSRRGPPSSPWTTVARGESDAIATPPPSSPPAIAPASADSTEPVALVASPSSSSMVTDDEISVNGNGSNGNAGKRPAWNKPSNGVVEAEPVMGAASWPALSKFARASRKPSHYSSKGLSDGSSSTPVPQITGSASSTSQKQVSHYANPNFTPNHTMPHQRSFKRNAGNPTSNGSTSQPTGSQPQTRDVHSINSSPRDHAQRNSQSRNSNDHSQQQRNSFRRNGGPHSRDGSHHHNYNRRDQDRVNQDWNSHRNFNGRDAHMQPQRAVARFIRPTHSTGPFIGHPPVDSYGNPIGFHEPRPMYYYSTIPLIGHPPVPPFAATMQFYNPTPDSDLYSQIVKQIHYYFSNENLVKDTFLRRNMDDQGFVPIRLIAGFNQVLKLTDNIQLILDALRSSTVVEVQGDKVRKRDGWMEWIMPPSVQFPNFPGAFPFVRPSNDMLVAGFQSISLEENSNLQSSERSHTNVHNGGFLGDLYNQSQVSSAEGSGRGSVQGVSDSSTNSSK